MNNSHKGTEDTELDILNKVTEQVIGCAIEVHRNLGPGLLESIYESALCIEFDLNKINYKCQVIIPVQYKNRKLGDFRLDLLVEDKVIVELKAVSNLSTIYNAQVLSYLRMAGKRIGLLINFNEALLKNGIERLIL